MNLKQRPKSKNGIVHISEYYYIYLRKWTDGNANLAIAVSQVNITCDEVCNYAHQII